MPEFLFLFFYRSVSGVQNAFGYAKSHAMRAITGVVLAFLAFMPLGYLSPAAWRPGVITACILAVAGAAGVEFSFNRQLKFLPRDIHLYETVTTGMATIAWLLAGGNLVLIAASVYPAMILHKMAINLGAGLPLLSDKTDDPAGRYFTIPILRIRIPRLGFAVRIPLAVVSLGLAWAAWRYGWQVTVFPFKIHF